MMIFQATRAIHTRSNTDEMRINANIRIKNDKKETLRIHFEEKMSRLKLAFGAVAAMTF